MTRKQRPNKTEIHRLITTCLRENSRLLSICCKAAPSKKTRYFSFMLSKFTNAVVVTFPFRVAYNALAPLLTSVPPVWYTRVKHVEVRMCGHQRSVEKASVFQFWRHSILIYCLRHTLWIFFLRVTSSYTPPPLHVSFPLFSASASGKTLPQEFRFSELERRGNRAKHRGPHRRPATAGRNGQQDAETQRRESSWRYLAKIERSLHKATTDCK
jgi:hypothetical protein